MTNTISTHGSEDSEGVAVLTVTGALTEARTKDFVEDVELALAGQGQHLLVDLTQVTTLDSAGIGALGTIQGLSEKSPIGLIIPTGDMFNQVSRTSLGLRCPIFQSVDDGLEFLELQGVMHRGAPGPEAPTSKRD